MTESNERSTGLAQRIVDRFASGACVVIVQEADEFRALSQAKLACASFPPFSESMDILSVASDSVLGRLAALANGRAGTVIVLDLLTAVAQNPVALRFIRQIQTGNAQSVRLVLIEQPSTPVPAYLTGDTEVIIPALPTIEEIRKELDSFLDRVAERLVLQGNGETRYALAAAVAGLPLHEAALLFSRCFIETGNLTPSWLRAEKAKRVQTKLGGALTFETTDGPDIGGAEALRAYARKRGRTLGAKAARDYGLPQPKGLLLAGGPGNGKSEFARFIARQLGLPLMRLDIGRVMGSLVGESERNMRLAQEAIVACAPVVVLLDEVDKGFGGVTSGSGDSGTSQRVFGSFLTFLAENTQPVYVIGTANRPWALPSEFIRSGRFDKVFHLSAPDAKGRAEIAMIHLNRFSWPLSAADADRIAAATEGFSGAEIRQAIIEAGFSAFDDGGRKVTVADVLSAAKAIIPISVTAKDDVAAMETWAKSHASPATEAEIIQAPTVATVAKRGAR